MDLNTDRRVRQYMSDRQGGMNRVIEDRFRNFLNDMGMQNA